MIAAGTLPYLDYTAAQAAAGVVQFLPLQASTDIAVYVVDGGVVKLRLLPGTHFVCTAVLPVDSEPGPATIDFTVGGAAVCAGVSATAVLRALRRPTLTQPFRFTRDRQFDPVRQEGAMDRIVEQLEWLLYEIQAVGDATFVGVPGPVGDKGPDLDDAAIAAICARLAALQTRLNADKAAADADLAYEKIQDAEIAALQAAAAALQLAIANLQSPGSGSTSSGQTFAAPGANVWTGTYDEFLGGDNGINDREYNMIRMGGGTETGNTDPTAFHTAHQADYLGLQASSDGEGVGPIPSRIVGQGASDSSFYLFRVLNGGKGIANTDASIPAYMQPLPDLRNPPRAAGMTDSQYSSLKGQLSRFVNSDGSYYVVRYCLGLYVVTGTQLSNGVFYEPLLLSHVDPNGNPYVPGATVNWGFFQSQVITHRAGGNPLPEAFYVDNRAAAGGPYSVSDLTGQGNAPSYMAYLPGNDVPK